MKTNRVNKEANKEAIRKDLGWMGIKLLFPVMVLLLVTYCMSGFTPFYAYQFEQNDISAVTGIEQKDLKVVIKNLAQYITGFRPTLNHDVSIHGVVEPIYGEREIAHMVDVRHIFDAIRVVVAIYALALTAYLLRFKKEKNLLQNLQSLGRFGAIGTVAIVVGLGILVSLDFTKYFIAFHELFFNNDLWLLDPATDVLIQMLPEVFFRDIAIAVLMTSLAFQVGFVTIIGQVTRFQGTNKGGKS